MKQTYLENLKNNNWDPIIFEKIMHKIINENFPDTQIDYDRSPCNSSDDIAMLETIEEYHHRLIFDADSYVKNIVGHFDNDDLMSIGNHTYFNALCILYHELAHAFQRDKYDDLWHNHKKLLKRNFDRRKKHISLFSKRTVAEFFVLNYFEFIETSKVTDKIWNLLPGEHEANVEGLYQAICFFEQNDIDYLLEFDKTSKLLKFLLSEYTLNEGNLISPFEKIPKNIPLEKEDIEEIENSKQYIIEYGRFLDPYTKLAYGLPIDRKLFEEVKAIRNLNFDNTQDVKRYIKKL